MKKYQRGEVVLVVLVMLVAMFTISGYYIGKFVQRYENIDNCMEHNKVEITNNNQYHDWAKCELVKRESK